MKYNIEKYNEAKVMIKKWQDEADFHKEQILAELGDVEKLEFDDFVISNKIIKSDRFDTNRLKEEHPDVWKFYSKESFSTRFEIKLKGLK